MAAIKDGLEAVTLGSAKALAEVQTGIDRVLWGKNALVYSAVSGVSGSVSTQGKAKANSQASIKASPKPKNPLDLGLYPILDVLVSVDMCNILNYLVSNTGGKSPHPRSKNPTKVEKDLYKIQDRALQVQTYIDQFLSSPNELVGKYTGLGPDAKAPNYQGAVVGTNVPSGSMAGSKTQKFNAANLIQYIKSTFADGTINVDGESIFTPDDQEVISSVPGMSSSLNVINDFIKSLDKYSDYRNISNAELQTILQKINKLRTICAAIQGFDFKNPASYLALLPPSTVQAMAAKLQKWINPTEIMPTVKKISDAVQSFIKTVQRANNVLTQGQFVIKIGMLLIKIFKFIVGFLKKLPIPNLYTTTGTTNTFSSVVNKLEGFLLDLEDVLAQINSLLAVFVSFVRYVQANTIQLTTRIQSLYDNLASCQPYEDVDLSLNGISLKDSDVVKQLQTTNSNLSTLNQDLLDFLSKYDNRANNKSSTIGKYTIKIVEEEITDKSIRNKRRRGIALDVNGIFVVQSDLTFATNDAIIIEEVRRKLLGSGLLKPGVTKLGVDPTTSGVGQAASDEMARSLAFLDEGDEVTMDDLRLAESDAEDPDNEDEDNGLGLHAFINKLSGGKRLRRRVRNRMAKQKAELVAQLQKEGGNSPLTAKLIKETKKSGAMDRIDALKANIKIRKEEIVALLALSIIPNPATIYLIAQKKKDIVASQKEIARLEAAIR